MGGSAGRDRRAAQEKVAQMRAKEQARERRRTLLVWGAVLATVALIGGAVAFAIVREQANKPSLAAVKTYTVTQGHVNTPVTYQQTPPAGGEHAPRWLNCATYAAPVPNENAVHSMEHGAVWVTYKPDLPAEQVQTLKDAMPATYAILSPHAGLKAPVVASAWGKQLELTGADDPRLPAFIKQFRQGPQTPEPGAICTGGTDGSPTTGQPAPGNAVPRVPAPTPSLSGS